LQNIFLAEGYIPQKLSGFSQHFHESHHCTVLIMTYQTGIPAGGRGVENNPSHAHCHTQARALLALLDK
jgi:hypothetical protein